MLVLIVAAMPQFRKQLGFQVRSYENHLQPQIRQSLVWYFSKLDIETMKALVCLDRVGKCELLVPELVQVTSEAQEIKDRMWTT